MKKLLRYALASMLLLLGIVALMLIPDERLDMGRFIVLLLVTKAVFFLCVWGAWQVCRRGGMGFFN